MTSSSLVGVVVFLLSFGCFGCGGDRGGDREPRSSTGILDLDYLQRRFFFLVDPVDPLLIGQLVPPDQSAWIPPPLITDLAVYRDDRNQQNNGGAVLGLALLNAASVAADSDSVTAFFDPLAEFEHFAVRSHLFVVFVDSPGQQQLHRYRVLEIMSPIGRDEVLAATFTATYRIAGRDSVVRYGTERGIEPVRAKALYIPEGRYLLDGDFYSRTDFWYPVRRLELRNIYSLGASNIDVDNLELSVKRATGPDSLHFPNAGSDVTYLRGLGVDKENRLGQPVFDHQIDRVFIDPARGLMILPDLRPFAPGPEDSVWSPYYTDITAGPPGRPAFFSGEHANRAIYDKRVVSPGVDGKYFFDVGLSSGSEEKERVPSAP